MVRPPMAGRNFSDSITPFRSTLGNNRKRKGGRGCAGGRIGITGQIRGEPLLRAFPKTRVTEKNPEGNVNFRRYT